MITILIYIQPICLSIYQPRSCTSDPILCSKDEELAYSALFEDLKEIWDVT